MCQQLACLLLSMCVLLCSCVDRSCFVHMLVVLLQPTASVKTAIHFRLLVFSSLFISLNTDLNRDDDPQSDRLKVPPSSSASNMSPQPVSSRLCIPSSFIVLFILSYTRSSASNYVVHPQMLIFLVFKIVSFFSYWFQMKVLSKSYSRCFISCWLLTNTAVTAAVTNFRCHILIAKVNK